MRPGGKRVYHPAHMSLRKADSSQVGKVELEGFIITDAPIDAYGGVQLGPLELDRLLSQLTQPGYEWLLHHDPRRTLQTDLLHAEIRTTASGHRGVWVRLLVEEADLWAAEEAIRGFSVSGVEEQVPIPANDLPRIFIATDAGHWDDASREELALALAEHFAVGTGRLYQFSFVPPPHVIIEFTAMTAGALASGVAGNLLWDVIKTHLLRTSAGLTSAIRFRVDDQHGRLDAVIETSDPEMLRLAIAGLREIANRGPGVAAWADGEWVIGEQAPRPERGTEP